MKKVIKKYAVVLLLLSMVSGSLLTPKQASAKSMSKVTKTVTLKSGKSVKHMLSVDEKDKLFVKVKILEVKGRVSLKYGADLWWGYYEFSEGKGSFFYPESKPSKLKANSFKKGKILTSKEEEGGIGVNGKTDVEWDVPNGISKLKIQVTYYTKSGKAGIKSVK